MYALFLYGKFVESIGCVACRSGLFVDVDVVDLLGDIQIVGVILEQAPTLVLCQEPHAI